VANYKHPRHTTPILTGWPIVQRVSTRPFMIGIAGGSSSGKTTVTERLVSMTGPEHLSLIELDSYYLDLGDTPIEQRRTVNYDHPDAFDWALLNDHLAALANGASVPVPVYDYGEHNRSDQVRMVEPARIVVVDGILVLWDRTLRERFDLKISAVAPGVVDRSHVGDVDLRGRACADEFETVAAPEPAGVVPVRRAFVAEQAHPLEGDRHEFGAVDVGERHAVAHPPLSQCRPATTGTREGSTAVLGDDGQRCVLHLGRRLDVDLPEPRLLAVAVRPHADRPFEVVELGAAFTFAGPHVGHARPELGVPDQRRQVVDRQHDTDVVDRAVGEQPDGTVGDGSAPKEPDVAGARLGEGVGSGIESGIGDLT
jgi:uridine kinase